MNNNKKLTTAIHVILLSLSAFVTIKVVTGPLDQSVEDIQEEEVAMRDPELIVAWIRKQNPKLSRTHATMIVQATHEASHRYAVDPLLLIGMMKHESGLNPSAKSGYGAQGLMQVVTHLHQDKFEEGVSPYGIRASINAGAKVLSLCQRKAKWRIRASLACYSGYSKAEVAPYQERVLKNRANLLKFINSHNT